MSEEELLTLLRKADAQAFTEIYNRYWEKLLATGFYYTHNKQEAEDIVHEVLVCLWLRKNSLDLKSLNAYLGTAVKFAVFKAIARAKRRRELLEKKENIDQVSDIEEKLEARFLQEYMQGAVDKLPEKAKLVFTYSRHEELTIKEIADKMDLSPKAVEYHMTKALRALKETLKKIKLFFL